jgi:DNA polymerase III epsilon subunit-like protein
MNSVVCDLETTSVSVFDAEIIEGHFIAFDENFKVLSTFELRCNPMKWSDEAEEIHKISRHVANGYKKFSEVYEGLLDWLCAYNITSFWCYSNVLMFGKQSYYDHAVLRLNMMNMGDVPYFAVEKIRPFSVHTLCKMCNNHFNFEDHKLSSICKTLGIELDAHNAKSDCEATLEILKRLLPLTTKEEIYEKEKGILNEGTSETNSKKPRKRKSTVGFL